MKGSGIIKSAMFTSGIMKLFQMISKENKLAILRYHSIFDPNSCYYASPSICIQPEIFELQVKYLSENFNVISLDEVVQCMSMQKQFPHNALVFTFDDGYKDNLDASNILKKYGVTGTFYISAECIDNVSKFWLSEIFILVKNTSVPKIEITKKEETVLLPLATEADKDSCIRTLINIIKSNDFETREDIRKQIKHQINDVADVDERIKQVMLTWGEVRKMHADGMTIGGHTLTHLNLPNAAESDARNEIEGCKSLIESKLGVPVNHFSYPNGGNYDYYNDQIKQMVIGAGYLTSTTSNNGVVLGSDDPFELNRIRVTTSIAEILYQISVEPLADRIKSFN